MICYYFDLGTSCCDSELADVGHFAIGSFFNHYVVAARNAEVNTGRRRAYVKRDVVMTCEHCYLVCADFVRGVSVGGNAVSTNNH